MLGSGLIGTFYTMTLQGYRAKDQVSVIYSRYGRKCQALCQQI
jgi:hypothetical protein